MQPVLQSIPASAAASFRCFSRRECRFDFEWHYHSACELTWIESGTGHRFVGDSIERYAEGDLVLMGPDLPHTWCSDADNSLDQEAVVMQFETAFAGERFWRLPEWGAVAQMLESADCGLVFGDAGDLRQQIIELPSACPADRLIGFLAILNDLAGRVSRPLATDGGRVHLSKPVAHRLDKACRFLAERFTQSIRQVEVADLVGMNAAAFSRFFKRATGRTMSQYVMTLRIGHACRMLVESDRTILEVATESGFENASYFHRQFRAAHRLSPRQYRVRFGPFDVEMSRS
jgi:AraC-like DNA-binding protein